MAQQPAFQIHTFGRRVANRLCRSIVPMRFPSYRSAVLTLAALVISSCVATPEPPTHAVQWLDPAHANLDSQTRSVLERLTSQADVNVMPLPPAERRRAHEALFAPLGLPPAQLTNVTERFIPGPGGPLRVRIYTPRDAAARPRPLLVYFHGGGMSVGSLEQYDPLVQRLSQRSGVLVVSVDYRLTPESRFPAPVEDAYAALQWTHDNAPEIGGDPDRLAIGGDSAGGNLAAVVSQLARDRGPPLIFQLLIYPAVGFDRNSESMQMFSHGYLFGVAELQMAVDQYISDPAQLTDPRLFPILARDLSGLPPAFVISAGYEIMRDDIERYARRMQEAGVPVELHRYETTIHPFLSMAGVIDLGRQAIDECADKLRSAVTRAAH
jgi:acetyl esterase